MTRKRTSTSTSSISVWKICEMKHYFRKLNSSCCRRLLKLQNIYPTFFLNMFRFLNKLSWFGVSDVTISLATWQSTNAQPRRCWHDRTENSKPISESTNCYSWSVDYDKTTFFVCILRVSYRGPVFGRNFFESDLAENFTIGASRDVESILKFSDFFLIPLGRYSLITY